MLAGGLDGKWLALFFLKITREISPHYTVKFVCSHPVSDSVEDLRVSSLLVGAMDIGNSASVRTFAFSQILDCIRKRVAPA
jgi:hypothetical protein